MLPPKGRGKPTENGAFIWLGMFIPGLFTQAQILHLLIHVGSLASGINGKEVKDHAIRYSEMVQCKDGSRIY